MEDVKVSFLILLERKVQENTIIIKLFFMTKLKQCFHI